MALALRSRWRPAALGLLLGALALPASAADPSLRWYTIETAHFRLHFHEGPHQQAFAQRAARTLEAAHQRLVEVYGRAPDKRTEVLLTDEVDYANGSATVIPRQQVHLIADVPDDLSVLNDYDDYLWLLAVHEYTHVLHLDDASGLPQLVNQVFGKLWAPNGIAPRWLIEGYATYQESQHSAGGRIRSSLFDAWLRALTLEQPFRIDEVTHNPTRWPRGNLAYLYGGRFVDFIARRVGHRRVADYFHGYGAHPVPWALNATARERLGEDFVSLYDAWQEELKQTYAAQLAAVEAAGRTPLRLLTRAGEGTGNPKLSPDGERVFYLEQGADRRVAIRSVRLNGSEDRRELLLWTGVRFDLAPDGARVAFSAGDVHREFSVYEDLYEADLRSGQIRRLTRALRATEPDYDPSGRRLAFVGRRGSGTTYLGLFDLRSGEVSSLLEAGADERLFTPAFSPDGTRIAFSQQRGAARHVRELEVATRRVRDLVATPFFNLQPSYTPDGELLFSSDRTGIYNAYALQPASGETRQLTNVVTAAFEPVASSDGRTLVVTALSSRGTDVARVDLGARAVDCAKLADREPRPPPPYRDDPARIHPVRDYQPWSTLLPQYWTPLFYGDPRGPVIGLTTGGADLVGRHRYGLQAGYGLLSGEPTVSFAYANRSFYPSLELSAFTGVYQAAGFPAGIFDRHWGAAAGVGLPLTMADHSVSLSAGYEWRAYVPKYSSALDPEGPRPRLPRVGSTGTLSLGMQVSNTRRYAEGISAEEGHVLAVGVRRSARETGGSFELASADARYQGYFALPWLEHHVLALRLAGGIAAGDLGDRPVFFLGGIALRDPVLQVLYGGRAGSGYLRGFAPGRLAGNSYGLANLEYRFPLVVVDRGLDTVPFFIKRLYGVAFGDVGTVGDSALRLQPLRGAVGGELRAELTFGVFASTELRAGLARGLAPDGLWDLFATVGTTY